ncbi:MFS transporter [Corynebacterium uropygiale]|uniref:MFS transporter n=1 Tax=Corynebacterium uropygiale TaxID=1775911 RepID=A0A9X1QT84_9CORY|nr:MFS transporter [Corynebacterium uropygiale]MCF4007388.1 MFS transporter [Corynebacterium uropygiale]
MAELDVHTTPLPPGMRRTDARYRRAVVAMLTAGLATFNAVYATQALLPALVDEFHVSPDRAALTVSVTTGLLAISIVPASILSERFGRGRVLIVSALCATLLSLALPWAPSLEVLIGLRTLQGVAVAGVPAVAMAWLSEELDPSDVGAAMGIYVAGTTVGGLSGRLIPSGLMEFLDWRWAMFGSSCIAVACALLTVLFLPTQRRFRPKSINPRHEFWATASHVRNPRLLVLFLSAFLGMGAFVSLYNFVSFRMMHEFGLSEGLIGLVFLMYLTGTWSSARVSRVVERFSRGRVMAGSAVLMLLSLLLLFPTHLATTLLAMALFTAAFFAIHSIASGWVGVLATSHRAEGSSMYLFCYYAGSSIVGWLSGCVFAAVEWRGLVLWLLLLAALLCGAAALALRAEQRDARRALA